jgi:hypothetical protein
MSRRTTYYACAPVVLAAGLIKLRICSWADFMDETLELSDRILPVQRKVTPIP